MCDDTDGICGCEEETGICTCKVLNYSDTFEPALGFSGHLLHKYDGRYSAEWTSEVNLHPFFEMVLSTPTSPLKDFPC